MAALLKNRPIRQLKDHLLLSTGALAMGAPLAMVFWSAARPGGLAGRAADMSLAEGLWGNAARLVEIAGTNGGPSLEGMFGASALIALGVAALTTAVAFLAAFAMVFSPGRAARVTFWVTLATLLFPIEARMLPTFDVARHLGLIDTLPGLILPILPLALATLVFRQHLKQIPTEFREAARLDGTGPLGFLLDFALPLSVTPIGAVFLIAFLAGWNQYLWPLMISIHDVYFPLMRGLYLAQAGSGPGSLLAALSILPAVLLVLGFQRLLGRVTAIQDG